MLPRNIVKFAFFLLLAATACQGQSRESMMSQASQLAKDGNHKGSVVVYKNLLEKYPGDTAAELALADAYLVLGRPAQAEAEIKVVLAKDPGNESAAVLMARVRNSEGKPEEALAILGAFLDAPHPSAAAFEQAGHAHLLRGDRARAQEMYGRVLTLNPANVRARFGLANCLLADGRAAEARGEVEALLKVAPRDKDGLLLLAQFQAAANEDDALLETFGLLAKYYPGDAAVVYREAFLRLSKRNDVGHAQAVADRLLRDAPKAAEGYKLKGLIYLAANQSGMAADPLHTALKIRPDVDTTIFLAQTYLGMGHLETAVSHLQSALSKFPDLEGPRRLLATIYLRQNRLDEAIDETQKLFSIAPSDEGGQRIMAEALVAKREYDKGLELFTRLAEKEGRSPTVLLKKGMLLALKGEDEQAEADLRKAVELGGGSLEPRVYLASFLAAKNRVDEAVASLGSGMDKGPEAAMAYNAMAKLRVRQGQLDQAMDYLDKARSIDPGVLNTYYNLAAIHSAKGETDKAALDFEAALAARPDDLRALLGAAGCREALGELDKARDWLERAATSRTPQATMALAEFHLRRSDNAGALAVLDKYLTDSPKDIRLWILKSRLHAAMGDNERTMSSLGRLETMNQAVGLLERAKFQLSRRDAAAAMETAGKLIQMNPASGDHYLPLAEIEEMAGKPADAEATYSRALAADQDNVRVQVALARLEGRQGKVQAALARLEKAVAQGADPAGAYALRGAIRQTADDTAGAAQEYEKALRYQDQQPLALNNLSMIYADQQGGSAKALDLAIRAYKLESNNASVLDTLGYALLRNGRAVEALAVLEQAEKLSPGNEEIARHLVMARESATAKQ